MDRQQWSRWYKRITVTLLVVLFSALIGVATVVSVCRDPGGRVWLLHGGLALLNHIVPEIHVNADKVVSPGLGDWRFERIAVDYQHQRLLMLSDVQLQFDWQALGEKRVLIEALTATSVDIHQPSAVTSAPDQSSAELVPMIDLRPWELVVDKLEVQQLRYVSSTGDQQSLPAIFLQSQFALWRDDIPLIGKLNGHSLQLADKSNFSFAVSSEVFGADRLQLQLDLEESAGGWLAAQLGLPAKQPIQLQAAAKLQADTRRIILQDLSMRFPWQGHTCEFSGELALNRNFTAGSLQQGQLIIDKQQQALTASWQNSGIDAELSLQQLPLDIFTPWLAPLQGGSYSGALGIRGPLENPRFSVDGSFRADALETNDIWQAEGTVKGSLHYPNIDLRAAALALNWQRQSKNSAEQPVAAAGRVDLQGEIELETPRLRLRGSAQQLDSRLVMRLLQRFDIAVPEWLQPLQASADFKDILIDGPLSNELRDSHLQVVGNVTGSYADAPLNLAINANGSWHNLVLQQSTLDYADASLKVDGRIDVFTGDNDFKANVRQFSLDILRMPVFSALLTDALQRILDEALTGTFSGNADVHGVLLSPQMQFSVEGEVQAAQFDYPLEISAVGHSLPQQVVVDALTLNVVEEAQRLAWLRLNGELDTHTAIPAMHWELQTEDFPLKLAEPFGWPDSGATLSSKLQLHFPGVEQFDAAWFAGTRLQGTFDYSSGPLELAGPGDDKGYTGIRWHGDLGGSDDQSSVELQSVLDFTTAAASERAGELNLQLQKDALAGFFLQQQGLPRVALQTRLDLRSVEFLLPTGTNLAGLLQADLVLRSEASTVLLDGQLNLQQALIASEDLGLTLKPITIEAQANGQSVQLTRIHAEDGRGGTLSATGSIDWQDPQSTRAVSLEMNADQLSLIEREEIQGEVSGALTLIGSLQHWRLSGELLVEPLNVSIDNASPGADIPSLDVSYQHKAEVETGATWQPQLDLAIDFRADKRAFLRGRSLNAELGGKLHLGGNLEHPEITGNFAVVRGYFELLGHRFVLTDGNASISDDSLTVLATGKLDKAGTEITAVLAATNEEVSFTLTSNPVMPEDEILAWLMFGKSMSNISAAQAVQLASALSSLRGGGFDPIGTTREMLGVDTLTLDTEETDNGSGVSVGAGKYLTDKVYLELKRTPDPAEPWRTSITIELSPRLSLRSTISTGTASQGVELEWRRDY